uniref:Alanine and proline rich membrane protein n=1 Tax=uncultured bacterium esnapd12 TaxID=1366592 RepID=S5TUI8_9BACT|nr:hypothetical protein [uncultured bacterium esnapd12]
MSELTHEDSAHSAAQPSRSFSQTLSRWVAPAALVLAVAAIAVAVWALLRSEAPAARFTDQQTSEAKGRICAAYSTVRTAVSTQTHADLGPEPVAVQAVAANARLAMAAGGSYLLNHLDPATPSTLTGPIRQFAGDLQYIAMNALAGVPADEPAQAARLRSADATSAQIAELCT